jgi:hypothetical protein
MADLRYNLKHNLGGIERCGGLQLSKLRRYTAYLVQAKLGSRAREIRSPLSRKSAKMMHPISATWCHDV